MGADTEVRITNLSLLVLAVEGELSCLSSISLKLSGLEQHQIQLRFLNLAREDFAISLLHQECKGLDLFDFLPNISKSFYIDYIIKIASY